MERVPHEDADGLRKDVHVVLQLRDRMGEAIQAPNNQALVDCVTPKVLGQRDLNHRTFRESFSQRMGTQLPMKVWRDIRLYSNSMSHDQSSSEGRLSCSDQFSTETRSPLPG
jgi:hypothetical protein